MKFFQWKNKDQKIKELVKETMKSKPINTQDLDLARLEKMSMMVQRMQGAQPQNNPNAFLQQMMQFEQFKSGMMNIENAKIEKLREEFEQEAGDSDDGLNPDQVMKVLGGFLDQSKQQKPKDPFAPTTYLDFPQATQGSPEVGQRLPEPQATQGLIAPEEQPQHPLVELNPLEKKAVSLAVKKIPKMAKNAFKGMTEDKKEAVLNSILDGIEQE